MGFCQGLAARLLLPTFGAPRAADFTPSQEVNTNLFALFIEYN